MTNQQFAANVICRLNGLTQLSESAREKDVERRTEMKWAWIRVNFKRESYAKILRQSREREGGGEGGGEKREGGKKGGREGVRGWQYQQRGTHNC